MFDDLPDPHQEADRATPNTGEPEDSPRLDWFTQILRTHDRLSAPLFRGDDDV